VASELPKYIHGTLKKREVVRCGFEKARRRFKGVPPSVFQKATKGGFNLRSRFRPRDFYKAKDPLRLEKRSREQVRKQRVPRIMITLKEILLNAPPNICK
jgi:hypothetical protein